MEPLGQKEHLLSFNCLMDISDSSISLKFIMDLSDLISPVSWNVLLFYYLRKYFTITHQFPAMILKKSKIIRKWKNDEITYKNDCSELSHYNEINSHYSLFSAFNLHFPKYGMTFQKAIKEVWRYYLLSLFSFFF